ncbi:MAG: hypothetical protein ABR616_15685 [Dermatophilaceae bacterium]
MRYRSKPSEVEAIQWTGDNLEEIEAFGVKFKYTVMWIHPLRIRAGKEGAQGYVDVPVGHWVVRQPGDLTDHWPVEDAYFAAKYERLPEFPT